MKTPSFRTPQAYRPVKVFMYTDGYPEINFDVVHNFNELKMTLVTQKRFSSLSIVTYAGHSRIAVKSIVSPNFDFGTNSSSSFSKYQWSITGESLACVLRKFIRPLTKLTPF